jgi:hypothetical protein
MALRKTMPDANGGATWKTTIYQETQWNNEKMLSYAAISLNEIIIIDKCICHVIQLIGWGISP